MDNKKSSVKKKRKWELFDIINTGLVILITLIIIYPLYFCVIASFSDPSSVARGEALFWVKGFTMDSYKNVIKESRIWTGYRNTIIYTVFGTLYNIVLTIPVAYGLSKKNLPLRGAISWFFFLTMYIGGGMIPSYLLIKSLHLLNNPLVMIVGTGVSCWNMIIARQYFSNSIHPELFDAAYIDGASHFAAFTRVALPLAKPIIAVLTLYHAVGHWNSFMSALLYLYKLKYQPLQLVLRSILLMNQSVILDEVQDASELQMLLDKMYVAEGMKYSLIFIACLPLMIVYPFLQKYFAKGVMVGSVKG